MDTSRLKKIDLFSDLDDDALQRVADMARETTADEGRSWSSRTLPPTS